MAITKNNRSIGSVYHNDRVILTIYKGYRIIWEYSSEYQACYANGLWKDEYPWLDNLPWKD